MLGYRAIIFTSWPRAIDRRGRQLAGPPTGLGLTTSTILRRRHFCRLTLWGVTCTLRRTRIAASQRTAYVDWTVLAAVCIAIVAMYQARTIIGSAQSW